MDSKVNIDTVYRIAVDSVIVTGWCIDMEPSTLLHWYVKGGEKKSECLGNDRIYRADVLEALGEESGSTLAYGFALRLENVPDQADQLHLELLDTVWTCPIKKRNPVLNGAVDSVFRVSASTLLLGGWIFEQDPSTLVRWSTECGAKGESVIGSTRICRPDVLQNLHPSEVESPDCGFLVALDDVPSELESLTVSIRELSVECEIVDLRSLPLSLALNRLLVLINWGSTPAERAESLLRHQGLGRAILSLIACADHSLTQKRLWQLNHLGSSKSYDQRRTLLLCCSHDTEFLRLQLIKFFEALGVIPSCFNLLLLPHPSWTLLDPEEWDRLTNLLALQGECKVSILSFEPLYQPAHVLIDERLDFENLDFLVVLGSNLLPASSAALSQLNAVLCEEVRDQYLQPDTRQHQKSLPLQVLLGHGGCCLFHASTDGFVLQPSSRAVLSCFQEWDCQEPQPAPGLVKGLAFWRLAIRSFVAESMIVGSIQ